MTLLMLCFNINGIMGLYYRRNQIDLNFPYNHGNLFYRILINPRTVPIDQFLTGRMTSEGFKVNRCKA